MRLDEYQELIRRQTGINVADSLPLQWNQFVTSPTNENLDSLITEIQRSGFDGETSQIRAAFNSLQSGIDPNAAVPFAVRINRPPLLFTPLERVGKSASAIPDAVKLRNLIAPNHLGDLVSYRAEEWKTDIHFTVTSSTNLDASGRFEEVPQDSRAIVIWFHGAGAQTARGTNFYQEMNQLARYGLASISMDMPYHGHGPRDKEYNAKELAEWTHEIVIHYRNRYPGKPIILAGHSFGPSAILNYLSTYPETHGVNGAVLMSPGGPFDERGMKHHNVEYEKSLSEELQTPGELRINQAGSMWAGRLQMALQFLKPGTVEKVRIPVMLFAGENDELYPDMDYLRNFASRIPNAKLVIGKGLGHYIFTVDQNPVLGEETFVDTFGESRAARYRNEHLRFVSALVLDFVDEKFGTGDQTSSDPTPKQALELYQTNGDFRKVVDITTLEDIKSETLEDVRKKMGEDALAALGTGELSKIIEPYLTTFKDMGAKKRKDARSKMANAAGSLPKTNDAGSASALNLSELSEDARVIVEELISELGTRRWVKTTREERTKIAASVSGAVESIYRGEDLCEIDERVAARARGLVEKMEKMSALKLDDARSSQKLLASWDGVRLARSLYVSNETFRTNIAGGNRESLLKSNVALQALEAWGHVRTAVILFEMNDTFRAFAKGDRAALTRPDNAAKVLSQWDKYRDSEEAACVKNIPLRYQKFYESLAMDSSRRNLHQSDIDEFQDSAATKGKTEKTNIERRYNLRNKILSALREYLEKEQLDAMGEDVYRLSVLGEKGLPVRTAWNHFHFHSADVAVSAYRGTVPTWDWYKQYSSEMDKAACFQSPYREANSARMSEHLQGRLEEIEVYRGKLGIQAEHVVAVSENGDLLSPFRLFAGTDHVTILSPLPFGPPNFEHSFTPSQVAFAHEMVADPYRLTPLSYEANVGVGGFYINAILTSLAPEMKPSAIRSIFYFKIVDGKKVYIEPSASSPAPNDYSNAEITFRDSKGSVKTLDMVANSEGSFSEVVRGYLTSLKPQALYVGPKAVALGANPSAVEFVGEVMESAGTRLVVARTKTTDADWATGMPETTAPQLRQISIIPEEVVNLTAHIKQSLAAARAASAFQDALSETKARDPISIGSLKEMFGQRLLPASGNFARGGLLYTIGDLGSDALLGNWERLRNMTPKKLAEIYVLLSGGNAAGQLTANTLLKGVISRVPSEILRNSIGGGLPLFFGFVALELGETGKVDPVMLPFSMTNVVAVRTGVNRSVELFRKSKFGMRIADKFLSKVRPNGKMARIKAGSGMVLRTIIEFAAMKVLDEIENDWLRANKIEIVTENLKKLLQRDLELLHQMQRGEDVALEEMLNVEAELFAYKTYLDEMAAEDEGKPSLNELAAARFASAGEFMPPVIYVDKQKRRAKEKGELASAMSGMMAEDGMPGPPFLYTNIPADIDENYSKDIADVSGFKVFPKNFSSHWWPLSIQLEKYLRDRNGFIVENAEQMSLH